MTLKFLLMASGVLVFTPYSAAYSAVHGYAQSPAGSPTPEPPSFINSNPLEQALNKSESQEELSDLSSSKEGVIQLTLEACVRKAIQTATSVLVAQNDIRTTGAQVLQSYAQFLPNINTQANYSYAKGTSYFAFASPAVVKGSAASLGYTVTSVFNIFNGLSDISSLKSSLLKKEASELSLERAKQQISLDMTQAFLQVILDNKIVDIARNNLQESQAREKLLVSQTKLGARSLSDLFRQQAQTSADESFLLTSKNKTRADQILLLYKLRLDIQKGYRFQEPDLQATDPEPRFASESLLIEQAIKNRSDLTSAAHQAEAAHWDVKSTRSGYLPRLDLVGQAVSSGRTLYSQNVNGINVLPATQNTLDSQIGNQVNYTLGLTLTWSLFDRFLTTQTVAKSEVTANNLDLASQDKINQIKGDARRAYGDYLLALQQLSASKKGLEAAKKAYAVMEGRYKVGASSFIDLVTVQASLVQAESQRIQALIDFKLQGKSVEFAIGETPIN